METIPETTGRHRSPGRETAIGGGGVMWPGDLSPEERRVHQVLAEVREGLDVARLAEAASIPKLALYRVLEGLRGRGLVEAYPGSPVLFYASEGRRGSGKHSPAPSFPERPSPTPPFPPSPLAFPIAASPEGPEPGSLSLVWEPRPERSLDHYRAAVRRGAPGLLIGRAPLGPRPSRSETETGWVGGLAPSEPGTRVSLGGMGPPPRAERLDEVVRAVREAGPRAAVLLDGLEYLVARHGFDSVLRMVYHLRELASLHRMVLLLPVDPRALEPQQRALLEREARVL